MQRLKILYQQPYSYVINHDLLCNFYWRFPQLQAHLITLPMCLVSSLSRLFSPPVSLPLKLIAFVYTTHKGRIVHVYCLKQNKDTKFFPQKRHKSVCIFNCMCVNHAFLWIACDKCERERHATKCKFWRDKRGLGSHYHMGSKVIFRIKQDIQCSSDVIFRWKVKI